MEPPKAVLHAVALPWLTFSVLSSPSLHHVVSAYSWIQPPLSSLGPTCGGVRCCSLIALDPKTLLESCSALCNQQQQSGVRLLGEPSLYVLLADSRLLLDKS